MRVKQTPERGFFRDFKHMAERIEVNPNKSGSVNDGLQGELGIQAGLILDGQQALHQLSEEGLWDAQDRNASLGAYRSTDFAVVEIDVPRDPLEVLKVLWSAYVDANPNLPDGKMVITGRTARAHNLLPHAGQDAALKGHNSNGHEVIQNGQLPNGELVFAETTTATVT